jgi:hypothetical protein
MSWMLINKPAFDKGVEELLKKYFDNPSTSNVIIPYNKDERMNKMDENLKPEQVNDDAKKKKKKKKKKEIAMPALNGYDELYLELRAMKEVNKKLTNKLFKAKSKLSNKDYTIKSLLDQNTRLQETVEKQAEEIRKLKDTQPYEYTR